MDILDYHHRWKGRQKISSNGAAKGVVRPWAITLLVFLVWEGHVWFESPPYRTLTSSFYKLSRCHRLNMESQSQFTFRCETKKKQRKMQFHHTRNITKDQDRVYKESKSFSACPEAQEVPAVILVCLSGDVSSASISDPSSIFNACISAHVCIKCRNSILAYFEQLDMG